MRLKLSIVRASGRCSTAESVFGRGEDASAPGAFMDDAIAAAVGDADLVVPVGVETEPLISSSGLCARRRIRA